MFKTPAFIACLDDIAVMREAIQQRRCHFAITENRRPFSELEICREDHGCSLVKAADKMEQQVAAGLGEGEIPKLVKQYYVPTDQLIGQISLTSAASFIL